MAKKSATSSKKVIESSKSRSEFEMDEEEDTSPLANYLESSGNGMNMETDNTLRLKQKKNRRDLSDAI